MNTILPGGSLDELLGTAEIDDVFQQRNGAGISRGQVSPPEGVGVVSHIDSVAECQVLFRHLLERAVKGIPQKAHIDAIRQSFPHIQEALVIIAEIVAWIAPADRV